MRFKCSAFLRSSLCDPLRFIIFNLGVEEKSQQNNNRR
jgi:hypothetical protein